MIKTIYVCDSCGKESLETRVGWYNAHGPMIDWYTATAPGAYRGETVYQSQDVEILACSAGCAADIITKSAAAIRAL